MPPDELIYLLYPKPGDPRNQRNCYDFFNLTDN